MNKLLLENQDKDKKTITPIKELEERFHGKVTIHFAHGVPKKVEVNKVEEVPNRS